MIKILRVAFVPFLFLLNACAHVSAEVPEKFYGSWAITFAKGGESYHNYGLAIDVVEISGGKAVWNTNWGDIAKIGISHGFSWGGNWTTRPDKPHFQMDFGLSIKQLQQGQRP